MWRPGAREAWLWTAALLFLAVAPAIGTGQVLCIFRRLGFPWCPGCGLGHAVQAALHGEFRGSFAAHPLGGIAVVVLGQRIGYVLLG